MRLELCSFPVTDVSFGHRTGYDSGSLQINKDELVRMILSDQRITKADVEIVRPGEEARITWVRDVVEPRVKVSGPGGVFPGIIGPLEPVGTGTTHRLSGIGIVASVEYTSTLKTGSGRAHPAVLDMFGPAASISIFASTINVVLIMGLQEGLNEFEGHAVVQAAECKAAEYLARATLEKQPNAVEVFDLTEVSDSLPKVGYILGFNTSWYSPTGVHFYGMSIKETLPTLVHPNIFFDGAVTPTAIDGARRGTLWEWCNHPIIRQLYSEHGKSLNFSGVILHRSRWDTHGGKEIAAYQVAEMAHMLRWNGAMITWLLSGNAFVDTMLAIRACERRGIKMVLVVDEYTVGKGGTDLPLIMTVPEADAMVSTGTRGMAMNLPSASRVVGPNDVYRDFTPGRPEFPANGPLSLDSCERIVGAVDPWGRARRTCETY
ncbi:MAG: hypothetical protein HY695_19380 [Deltaproteobacteria bacterium]|nr:hypothetical protein [Deltaproteobacteria bacterium]